MGWSVLGARGRESMYVIQIMTALVASAADFEAGAIHAGLWEEVRLSPWADSGWPCGAQEACSFCAREHRAAVWLLTAAETNVFSCQHYQCFPFFCFPLYTTVTVTQGWRKKQLQWGTALKRSYFVPFLLMQTFYGLSTWIAFWWYNRTIFARTHLIAVLSTLCDVHYLYFHLVLSISYMLPKIAYLYEDSIGRIYLFACMFIFLKAKSCLKTSALWLTFQSTSIFENLLSTKLCRGGGFILEQPSIAGCKKLSHNKAKINSADSDFVAKPSRTCYSSEEDRRHAKILQRLLHTSFLTALLGEDGVCWLKLVISHKQTWAWKA